VKRECSTSRTREDVIVIIKRSPRKHGLKFDFDRCMEETNWNHLLSNITYTFPNRKLYIYDVTYSSDKINICSTVTMFSAAKIIVGIHGAGLTNLMWASTNSTIIEITNNSMPNVYYKLVKHTFTDVNYIRILDNMKRNEFYFMPFTTIVKVLDAIKTSI